MARSQPSPPFALAFVCTLLLAIPALGQPRGPVFPQERPGPEVTRPGTHGPEVRAPGPSRGEPRPRPRGARRGLGDQPIAFRGASAVGRSPNHVLVRFAPSLAPGLDEQIAAGLGAPQLRRARFGDFSRVEVPPGETASEVLRRFRAHPSILWAEADPLVRAAAHSVRAAASTADPFFPRQWHLERIGLTEALERNPTDGDGVIVAVLDSGVAFGSGPNYPNRRAPDLEATHFVAGFDFVDDDPVALDPGIAFDDDVVSDPRFSHGTFAASIIAATVNNNLAGAGVAPRVSIMPIRVLGVDGFGTSSDIAEGIRFAVDNGARVLNLSLGGAGIAQVTREALTYAESRGVVVVAAAGNEADDSEVFEGDLESDVAYPARFPTVIAVGATGFDDRRTTYSNFGPGLDLMAPGGESASRMLEGNIRDAILSTGFVFNPVTGEEIYGGFWATGTSFSCPQVAGAAALLIALGVDDPEAVRAMLDLTARDLAAGGVDLETAHGLLDAAAAHRGLGFTQ